MNYSPTDLDMPTPEALSEARWRAGAPETPDGIGRGTCLHHLFEAQASRTPDAVAVASEAARLTYAVLDARSNRLARLLQRRGAGPETVVALYAERAPSTLVALLGILKAGACYVPLDPSYPAELTTFMLEDSHASLILAQESLRGRLAASPVPTLGLDRDGTLFAGESDQALDGPGMPESLAYVIYTSGSTGRPKGVMVTHASAVHSLHARLAYYPPVGGGFLLLSSFAFDSSVAGLFSTLSRGGTLWIPSEAARRDPFLLAKLIGQKRLGETLCVPSLYREILAGARPGELGSLVRVILAGESFAADLLADHHALLPGTALFNEYGPTEATVWSTVSPLRSDATATPNVIGRPIAGTRVYVLGPLMRPVPLGDTGELYIGGAGVARGYGRRPGMTSEKFVPDPFAHEPGSRLYRTGDLARYLSDGSLQFLGRVDEQVKIRGHRVELGEIESVVSGHPGVAESAVTAREQEGSRRLVAYFVARQPGAPSEAELRAFAQARLPDHMVPSAFVRLDGLPRTPAGKTDRAALPKPGKRRESGETLAPPRSVVERAIARVWGDLLHAERLGVHDNFFLLGGDSLLATQAISRLRRTFGAEISLRDLFDAPTIAGLAERLEALPAGTENAAAASLTRIPREGPLPLSFAQERIWFLDQLEPGTAAYNLCEVVRFRGALDVSALRRSLREIVHRHESFRTSFPTVDGAPLQSIAAPGDFALPVIDIQDLSETRRGSRAERLIQDEARRPFELARGPLVRAVLLRLAGHDHVLVWTTHHIISDGWSLDLFTRELKTLYEAFSRGEESPLPDPPFQYVDFSSWQRSWLDRNVLAGQIAYWKEQLRGPLPILALPTDRPRRAVPTTRGGRERRTLPRELSESLRDLSRRQGTTLFMTLLAGFETLLARYTGQDDVLVGTPIAGRTLLETEEIIGFFVNTLVLRVDFSGDPTFPELLERVRETALGAYAHQDLPFERLVEVLQPERTVSHSPLFQVMFALENPPETPLEFPGMRIAPIAADTQTAKFELTLTVLDSGTDLTAQLEYKTELFDSATIARMLEHFENLLRDAAASRGKRVSELTLLSPSEERVLLRDWNRTAADYPRDEAFAALFESQVERTPDAFAVSDGAARLTYRELNERANRLARFLARRGVGPERVAAICLERSAAMVVAILAVFKAGGAYLPLDPSHPAPRLAFMIEDAAADVILTEERLRRRLPPTEAAVVLTDGDARVIAAESAENLARSVRADNLAYVIYTSGSTGRPKGTLIPHRGLVNYLTWCTEAYPLREGRGSLVASSFAFDLTITGLFAPLLVGKTVSLLPEGDEPESLGKALTAGADFSLVKLTPSHLEVLQTLVPREVSCGMAHALIIGGEALGYEALEFWSLCAPDTRLINEYGPTETVVGCIAYEIRGEGERQGPVPIGRPISNTRVYVLDRSMRPAPIGVVGELYIGGDGLARGYRGRPDLTAAKFLPDPFAQTPGARLYRTGDLARYLPDANLLFLGRSDLQVKIRGHRVELGEIESALAGHPEVLECAVTIAREKEGGERLVAHVVAADAPKATDEALRAFARERLPEYMVPSAFVLLPALPRTAAGKVDRSALAAPGRRRGVTRQVAPRDQLEQRLVEIWQDLLHVSPVGVTDNFFDLGGHSLLAARLFARIEKAFGKGFPMSALFRAPTVEALAHFLREKGAAAELYSTLVPIQPNGSLPPLFYMHEVRGNVAGSHFLSLISRNLGPDQPIYAFQALGLDGTHAPHTSLKEMAAHYVREMRSVRPRGPYHLGGYSFGGVVAYEAACQLQSQGQSVGALMLLDTYYPAYFAALSGTASRVAYHLKHLLFDRDRLTHLRHALGRIKQRIGNRVLRAADSVYDRIGEASPRAPLTVLEANLEALKTWEPPVYAGRIVLLRSADRSVDLQFDPRLGWERKATGGVTMIDIPGEHATMLREPNVRLVAERVADCVRAAAKNTPST